MSCLCHRDVRSVSDHCKSRDHSTMLHWSCIHSNKQYSLPLPPLPPLPLLTAGTCCIFDQVCLSCLPWTHYLRHNEESRCSALTGGELIITSSSTLHLVQGDTKLTTTFFNSISRVSCFEGKK